MNDYVLVVGGGKNSVLLVDKIHGLGFNVIVVDKDRNAPAMPCANKKITLSTYESAPIIDKLEKLKKEGVKIIAAVTRSSGIPVIATAEIASHLKLPGVGGGSVAKALTYKHYFAEFKKKHGISSASFQKIDLNLEYYDQISNNIPCVIKPTLGFVGKRGVILILKESEIESAVDNARQASLNGEIIAEKFIPGIDVTLMSLVYNKILYPCFFLRELNEFDEYGKVKFDGFCLMDGLVNAVKKEIIATAKKIVETAKIEFSPLLISFRITDDGKAFPIEANLDFGGENVLENIIPKAMGFDFVTCYLKSIIYKQEPVRL